MALKRMNITVEMEVFYRDDLRPGEVVSDLRKILDSDAGRRLLCEQRPYRYHESGWWAERSTMVVPPQNDAPACSCGSAPPAGGPC